MCCMRFVGNIGCKNYAKNRHLHTIGQLRRAISSQLTHVLTTGKKNLLSSNIPSTCSYNMANFGPQMAETGSGVWGTPANLRLGFVTAATSSPEANQTLHDVWPSPGLVYCIFIFGALAQWWNFARCKIHLASKSCLLLYWQHYCTALQERVSAELFGMVQRMELRNFRRGCHLYSVGRPSDWASAHILVWHYFKMWLRSLLQSEAHSPNFRKIHPQLFEAACS